MNKTEFKKPFNIFPFAQLELPPLLWSLDSSSTSHLGEIDFLLHKILDGVLEKQQSRDAKSHQFIIVRSSPAICSVWPHALSLSWALPQQKKKVSVSRFDFDFDKFWVICVVFNLRKTGLRVFALNMRNNHHQANWQKVVV